MRVHYTTALAALLLLACCPLAQADQLDSAIEGVLTGARRQARVGVHVVALSTGRVIYRRNSTERMTCASNQKLITAAAALEELGADYEFRTVLLSSGRVEAGTLRGDLILRGGGDSTLGGRHDEQDAMAIFRQWARALRERGIRRIAGDVVGDDRFLDRQWYHPDWDPQQAWKWYYTTTGALSISDNCVMVTVRPGGSPGSQARVSLSPSSAPVGLNIRCATSSKRHSIWFARAPESATITVGGYVAADSDGYSHEVTVPEPTLYAAAAFMQALQEEGITVRGVARAIGTADFGTSRNATPLAVRRTPLLPVLRQMLQRSHNHYAEQVIKTIGAEAAGRGSWEAGTARAATMLRQMGFADREFRLADGSGLSRSNELTPALVASLLLHMRRSRYARIYEALLAVAGENGTLSNRLTDAPYAGNVRGKTGYLSGVGALSGYATTRSGLEVAFCILVNDSVNPPGTYSMRQTVDPICRAIVDHAR